MARLPPAGRTGKVADRLRQRRGGALTPLDDILLHSESLVDGWSALLGAVRTRFILPAGLREMAILRVGVMNHAHYAWAQHEPLLRQAGFSKRQVAALLDGGDTSVLTDVQGACLAYTEAMTRDVVVPQELFDRVLGHLGERQIVELTATVGAYNLVTRFVVAMEIGTGAGRELGSDPPGETQ